MFRKRIDTLQGQIDHLNQLIDETTQMHNERKPKALSERKHQRLGVMLLKLQDGELSRRGFERLEKWIVTDPAIRDYYINFMDLCGLLRMYYRPVELEKLIGSAAMTGAN